jgi:hypothetical protein
MEKLHIEELHDLYSSPNIVMLITSRRMRWVGHVARMGRRDFHTGIWWGYIKKIDGFEDHVDGSLQ